MHVSLEYPASGKKQDRPEPVLVQNSGHVDYDMQIFALDLREGWTRESLHQKRVGSVSGSQENVME